MAIRFSNRKFSALPKVSGDKVDPALLQGRLDDLAGAEPCHDLNRVALLAQGLAVQLGQGLALGKVEGGDCDDGPPRVPERWAFCRRGCTRPPPQDCYECAWPA